MPILLEGEGRVPTKEDEEIWGIQLKYRLEVLAPITFEIIKDRCQKEREEQKKFRDDSELLRPGQPDSLGQLHKSSGSRYGRGLFQKIIVAEVRHEHPTRNGWGSSKNMTREEYGKHASRVIKEKKEQDEIDKINLAFAEVERDRRR